MEINQNMPNFFLWFTAKIEVDGQSLSWSLGVLGLAQLGCYLEN